jgi:phage terminase large subunit-like protein
MENANKEMQTIHVSAASVPRRRVRQDKFILHPDLKKRLIKLINTNVPEQVKAIAQKIIDLTHVPILNKYCNYLGLSQADYTKISYLDEDRKNRLHGQVGIQHMIKPGTEAIFHYRRNYVSSEPDHGHYDVKLVLTARHLGGDVFPIKGFVTENREFTVTSYLWEDNRRSQKDHLFNFGFKNTFLEKDSRPLRIRNSRLVSSASFYIDQDGYQAAGGYNMLGVSFNKTETKVKEVWNYKQRYHTSVGKIVRRLFGDTYSDRDITAFAEAYATLITVSNPLYDFSIIEGDAIKDAYYYENYVAQTGSLGNSCMRHRQCQQYFDIYTKFPDKVKMAVLKRGNKIAARSIMWNINGKFMFDRIYFTTNETQNLLKNTLEAAGYSTLYCVGGLYSMEMDLDGITKFPYLDTLCNYDVARKVLTNGPIDGLRYELRNTSGDAYHYNNHGGDEDEDNNYDCSCCGNIVHYDNTIYVERGHYHDQRVCEDCAIYSESTGEYHTVEDDTVNTYQDDSILADEAIRLLDNTWAHQDDPELRQFENDFGYFILDEHDYLTDGNVYYHPNDENKPEDVYDSEEVNRRNRERLSQIMAITSLSSTLSTNHAINIHSNGNVGIGSLGIATYLNTNNTLHTITPTFSTFSSVIENQPEVEPPIQLEENNEQPPLI